MYKENELQRRHLAWLCQLLTAFHLYISVLSAHILYTMLRYDQFSNKAVLTYMFFSLCCQDNGTSLKCSPLKPLKIFLKGRSRLPAKHVAGGKKNYMIGCTPNTIWWCHLGLLTPPRDRRLWAKFWFSSMYNVWQMSVCRLIYIHIGKFLLH